MDRLYYIALALSIAGLSGRSLYWTVVVLFGAKSLGWIRLESTGADAIMGICSDQLLIALCIGLGLVESLATQIRWADSLWNLIHAVISPIAGAILASHLHGQTGVITDMVVAFTGGFLALVVRTAKTGTRLMVNFVPLPFASSILSGFESLIFFGTFVLIVTNAIVGLLFLVIPVAVFVYFSPRIFRFIRGKIGLSRSKSERIGHGTAAN